MIRSKLLQPSYSIRALALMFIFITTFGLPAITLGFTTEQKTELLGVTKEIILNVAELGLEEAGNRILGATAWHFFKQASKPVFDHLKQKYPGLFRDGKRGTPEIQEQAREAANSLERDPALQSLLIKGLSNLEKGQQEILKETRLLSVKLDRNNITIAEMSKLNNQKLDEILLEIKNIREQPKQAETTDVVASVVRVLIEDNFRTQRHWAVSPDSPNEKSYYFSDGLAFENLYRDNYQALYALNSSYFTGFVKPPARIELSLRQVAGATNQLFGLMFGGSLSSFRNAYTFSITTDGCYMIDKYYEDKQDSKIDYGCDADLRRRLYDENNLRLDITGRAVKYYRNGRLLGNFTASENLSGFIGIYLANPQQKVLLHNIRVSELGP